jgi:hypothetical protein
MPTRCRASRLPAYPETLSASRRARRSEIVEIPRGHALTIDSGWREVANTALAFVKRFV